MPRSRTVDSAASVTRFDSVIAEFGREVTRKLRTSHGSEEDHLRAPFERMLAEIAGSLGLKITTIGETRLPDLSIRPDYAVDVAGARVGYVELKKPGHGVPGTWPRPSRHDRDQWTKFQLLPNVLYMDGQQFARFKFGQLQGKVARLAPELDQAGDKLRAVDTNFARVVTDFLLWEPERPRTLDELVRMVATLCRLLRDDVAAELVMEQTGRSTSETFNALATDWRQVLFPNLTDAAFADQYAQTVTFALLLARVEGVVFQGRSVGEIARLLGKKHSLMGRALTVLTDQPEEEHSVALTTMIRVFSAVDWADYPQDAYAMLYEKFLAKYDPVLRRKSGVYYTPAPLVSFLTRFVDDVLRRRLNRNLGFADRDVMVVDPAMGTGSFLAEVVNTVARTVTAEEGHGAVNPRLRELSNRLIGFEKQAAPYAVAELRIHGLLKKRYRADIPAGERRFLTDTLDDPELQLLPLGRMYEAIERSRRGANLVKRDEPVMVVIGNPPHVDKVKGTAPWIETPNTSLTSPSIAAFRKPGNGRLEYVLANKYVYFWRWATWKAFDAHLEHPAGVVALVCPAGFTTGPGFAGMREYLRRTADEGWIVDLTPEGHQPPMATRFFQPNQQPICAAIFIRHDQPNPKVPARIRYTSVTGSLAEKSQALCGLQIDGSQWQNCFNGWCDSLQPARHGEWSALSSMTDLMPWASPGVKPNRTWVYAPDQTSLARRWYTLVSAGPKLKSALFRETRDANLQRVNHALPGLPSRHLAFADEHGELPDLVRVGFRSFDRQWIIPDSRLIATPRTALWLTLGRQQIFVIEQHAHPVRGGPALVFSSLIPDMHYHSGRGGRVFPLFRDAAATAPNIAPGLLGVLAGVLKGQVDALDLVAYLAAVTAHPGFARRFAEGLRDLGIRLPLTRSPKLWADAVRVGKELLWLHAYGERCVDPAAGRPRESPRMSTDQPLVRMGIPDTEAGMPERIVYDESTRTLHIGEGQIAPVGLAVWNYQVSGMRVLKHWYGYRKKNPTGKRASALDDIVATKWTAAMTTELLQLLNVLGRCVALEPHQDELLDRIVEGPLITVEDLIAAGVLPVPTADRSAPKLHRQEALFSDD